MSWKIFDNGSYTWVEDGKGDKTKPPTTTTTTPNPYNPQQSTSSNSESNNFYQKYVATAKKYGVTDIVSQDDFAKQYGGWNDKNGGFAGFLESNLYPQVAKQVNTAQAAYAKASGGAPDSIATNYDYKTYGDWRGRGNGYDDVMSNINSIGGLISKYNTDASNLPEKPPVYKYDAAGDTNVNTVEKEYQDIVAKGQPQFVKPTFNQSYVDKWNQTLRQIEQPNVDWATEQLNKSVNQQYISNNPYSVGSGVQMKASQDATNQLLQSVIANRDAQALALGTSDYNSDYEQAFNEWNLANNQYKQAQSGLLDISDYRNRMASATTDQQRYDYWTGMKRSWDTADTSARNLYQTQEDQRMMDYAKYMAENYKPATQNNLGSAITGALGGAATGFMMGGPMGAVIGGGVGGLGGYYGASTGTAANMGSAAGYGYSRYQPSYASSGGMYSANPNLNLYSGYPQTQIPSFNYYG